MLGFTVSVDISTRPLCCVVLCCVVLCVSLCSEPIQSRCAVLRFTRLSDAQVLERLMDICEKEKVRICTKDIFTSTHTQTCVHTHTHTHTHIHTHTHTVLKQARI